MKLIDILNEQDDSSSNMWTRPEIGIIQKLIKKGLDRFNPSEIMGYLNEFPHTYSTIAPVARLIVIVGS